MGMLRGFAGTGKPVLAVHLNAGNDRNGNPRRLFLVVDAGANVLAAVDEGFEGSAALERAGYKNLPTTDQISTTPSEYRELLRHSRAR